MEKGDNALGTIHSYFPLPAFSTHTHRGKNQREFARRFGLLNSSLSPERYVYRAFVRSFQFSLFEIHALSHLCFRFPSIMLV